MNWTKINLLCTLSTLLLSVWRNDCAAGIVAYNNFSVGDTYLNQGSWQGSSDDMEVMLAQRFTPTASGKVEKLELAMRFTDRWRPFDDNNLDELALSIVQGHSGSPGTNVLWSQTYTGNVPHGRGVISFDVVAGPVLQAGAKYWITSRSTSFGFRPHGWSSADAAIEPLGAFNIRASSGFIQGQWAIADPTTRPFVFERTLRVTLVPEPIVGAMLVVGAAVIFAYRRSCLLRAWS